MADVYDPDVPPARRPPPTSKPPPTEGGGASPSAEVAVAAIGASAASGEGAATGGAILKAVLRRVLGAFRRFFARRKSDLDTELLLLSQTRFPGRPEGERRRIISREQQYEAIYRKKALARIEESVKLAMKQPDAESRKRALEAVMRREKMYARMREQAMASRAISAQERELLKESSPEGAYWKLDPNVKTHTIDCLVMGERFWPWVVLDRVHPPMHAGCPCRLFGLQEAIDRGLMTREQIPDRRDALRTLKRLAADVPEIKARLREGEFQQYVDLLASERDLQEARRGADRQHRHSRGTQTGGQFARRGTQGLPVANYRALRALLPGLPRSPQARLGGKEGRRVWIKGYRWFVPEEENWSREVDGALFTSPAGSLNVYRNGDLVSEPGRRETHPDMSRAETGRPQVPKALDAKAKAKAEARDDDDGTDDGIDEGAPPASAVEAARRALEALDPAISPVPHGAEFDFLALQQAGFYLLDTRAPPGTGVGIVRMLRPQTGALFTAEFHIGNQPWESAGPEWLRRSYISGRWNPEGIPRQPAERVPHVATTTEEIQLDVLHEAAELGRRHETESMTRQFRVDSTIDDHNGRHSWDGELLVGPSAVNDITQLALLKRIGGGDPEMIRNKEQRVWTSYRVMAHEMGHGVNSVDPIVFSQGHGMLLEEALTEENAGPLAAAWLRDREGGDVILAAGARMSPYEMVSYIPFRGKLDEALMEAGIPPDRYAEAVEELKFRVPSADREEWLLERVIAYQGTTRDHAKILLEGALTSGKWVAPLTSRGVGAPPSGVGVGTNITVTTRTGRIHGVLLEQSGAQVGGLARYSLRTVDGIKTVIAKAGDVERAQAFIPLLELGPGHNIGEGETFSYDGADGERIVARLEGVWFGSSVEERAGEAIITEGPRAGERFIVHDRRLVGRNASLGTGEDPRVAALQTSLTTLTAGETGYNGHSARRRILDEAGFTRYNDAAVHPDGLVVRDMNDPATLVVEKLPIPPAATALARRFQGDWVNRPPGPGWQWLHAKRRQEGLALLSTGSSGSGRDQGIMVDAAGNAFFWDGEVAEAVVLPERLKQDAAGKLLTELPESAPIGLRVKDFSMFDQGDEKVSLKPTRVQKRQMPEGATASVRAGSNRLAFSGSPEEGYTLLGVGQASTDEKNFSLLTPEEVEAEREASRTRLAQEREEAADRIRARADANYVEPPVQKDELFDSAILRDRGWLVNRSSSGRICRLQHRRTGASLKVRIRPVPGGQVVDKVTDFVPGYEEFTGPPTNEVELARAMVTRARKLAERFGTDQDLLPTIEWIRGRTSYHQWNGQIQMANWTRQGFQRYFDALATPEGPTAHHRRQFYSAIKTLQHEINHGVNPTAPHEYSGAGITIEEALTEESAQVLTTEWLKEMGLTDVLVAAADASQVGTYQPFRKKLGEQMRANGLDPHDRELILRMKFQMSADERIEALGTGTRQNLKTSSPKRGWKPVTGFQPLLDNGLSEFSEPVEIDGVTFINGEEVELLRPPIGDRPIEVGRIVTDSLGGERTAYFLHADGSRSAIGSLFGSSHGAVPVWRFRPRGSTNTPVELPVAGGNDTRPVQIGDRVKFWSPSRGIYLIGVVSDYAAHDNSPGIGVNVLVSEPEEFAGSTIGVEPQNAELLEAEWLTTAK